MKWWKLSHACRILWAGKKDCGMKVWLILAAWAFAAPALAVPPILPAGQNEALVEEYIQAISNNDIAAYGTLFSPGAEVVVGSGPSLDRDQWLKAAAEEFIPTRKTRFLEAFAGGTTLANKSSTRVIFTIEMLSCRPLSAECFGTFRSETITVTDGKIVRLERTPDFSHRRRGPKYWTFYYTEGTD